MRATCRMLASANLCPMICRPTGRKSEDAEEEGAFPTGRLIAGNPAKLAGTGNKSSAYMSTLLPAALPKGYATVGAVGLIKTSAVSKALLKASDKTERNC